MLPEESADGVEPTGLRRGPYRNGTRRREQILEAATRVFGQFGYAGSSLRQIGEAVGASAPSLVQHFGSKEGLLLAVLERWDANFAARHHQGLKYFTAHRELMRYHVEHRGFIELFLTMAAEASEPSHPAHEFMRMRYSRVHEGHAGALREAVLAGEIAPLEQGAIEVEARLFIATLDGLELTWLIQPDVDLVTLFDSFLTATLHRWGAVTGQ